MTHTKKPLIEYLAIVKDPRLDRRKYHKMIDILMIALCASLSGCDTWNEIEDYGKRKQHWLEGFLELPNGIPSHDTFGRVFSIIDPRTFQQAFTGWVQDIQDSLKEQGISSLNLAIDGKFLKGALLESGRHRSALSIVSAWSTRTGLVLGQTQSALKKEQGEKRAMEELIKLLDLQGCLVSIDAGGATARITQLIIDREGDYLIGLKANQKRLLKRTTEAFQSSRNFTSYRTEEKNHGRLEVREYTKLKADSHLKEGPEYMRDKKPYQRGRILWPKLNCFVRVKSTRTDILSGDIQSETRYYFSSSNLGVRALAEAIRGHWGVENQLNRTLDVVFREDFSRVRIGNAAQNLAALRRLTLGLLKHETATGITSMGRKRKICAYDDRVTLKVLFGEQRVI
jgi:predicted transposase YbfD/YdcC